MKEANEEADEVHRSLRLAEIEKKRRQYVEAQQAYLRKREEAKQQEVEDRRKHTEIVKQESLMRKEEELTAAKKRHQTTLERLKQQSKKEQAELTLEQHEKALKLATQARWMEAHERKKREAERKAREKQEEIAAEREAEKKETKAEKKRIAAAKAKESGVFHSCGGCHSIHVLFISYGSSADASLCYPVRTEEQCVCYCKICIAIFFLVGFGGGGLYCTTSTTCKAVYAASVRNRHSQHTLHPPQFSTNVAWLDRSFLGMCR